MTTKVKRGWRVSPQRAQDVKEVDLFARAVFTRFPGVRKRGQGYFASAIVEECLRRALPHVMKDIKDAKQASDVAFLLR